MSHLSLGFGLLGSVTHKCRPQDRASHRAPLSQAGMRNAAAALDDDTIRAIRLSTETQRVTAKRYNTSQPNVSKIKARKVWSHLE